MFLYLCFVLLCVFQLSQSVRVKLKDFETQLMSDKSLTEDEKQAKLKAEKIKIALQKLKKARVQKVRFLWWKPSISSIDQFLKMAMMIVISSQKE